MSEQDEPAGYEPEVVKRIKAGVYDENLAAVHEARRLRRLKRPIRDRAQVLAVWCESGKCCVGRVYRSRQRLLFDVTSNEMFMPERFWTRGHREQGHGFTKSFGAWWIDGEDAQKVIEVTCKCNNSHTRMIEVSRLKLAAEDVATRTTNVAVLLRT